MTGVLAWCRERPWTWAVGAGILMGLAGYGIGRFAAPSRVTEQETAKWSATWDWSQLATTHQVAGPVHRTTTRRTAPGRPAEPAVNGVCPACPEVKEEVVEEDIGPVTTDTEVATTAKGAEAGESSMTKITEHDAPRWTIGATIGTGWQGGTLLPPAYGGLVGYRFAGPLGAQVQVEGGAGGVSGRVGLTLQF